MRTKWKRLSKLPFLEFFCRLTGFLVKTVYIPTAKKVSSLTKRVIDLSSSEDNYERVITCMSRLRIYPVKFVREMKALYQPRNKISQSAFQRLEWKGLKYVIFWFNSPFLGVFVTENLSRNERQTFLTILFPNKLVLTIQSCSFWNSYESSFQKHKTGNCQRRDQFYLGKKNWKFKEARDTETNGRETNGHFSKRSILLGQTTTWRLSLLCLPCRDKGEIAWERGAKRQRDSNDFKAYNCFVSCMTRGRRTNAIEL